MDGMRVVVPVHFHGTMAANGLFRWKVPCGLTLAHVSAGSSVDTNATVKIGNTGTNGDDDYMTAKDVGDAAAVAEYDRSDFVDGEYPHIAAGTTLLVTVDFDGASGTAAQNCSVVLTFLEG
jgi:hypothetical protein